MQVDVEAVDFGMVAFGFRYAKEFTLCNTCAIPMHYSWRVPKDSLDPAHKEFTVRNTALMADRSVTAELVSYLCVENMLSPAAFV